VNAILGHVLEPHSSAYFDLAMVRLPVHGSWRRKELFIEGFPEKFKVQRIGSAAAMAISELPPSGIAKYFREHPAISRDLLGESYDKRFTPSCFIEGKGDRFRVGWFTRDAK
jgi:hypothetical protein